MGILGSKLGSVPYKLCISGHYGLNFLPPNSYIKTLTPNEMVFGHEVIRVGLS